MCAYMDGSWLVPLDWRGRGMRDFPEVLAWCVLFAFALCVEALTRACGCAVAAVLLVGVVETVSDGHPCRCVSVRQRWA